MGIQQKYGIKYPFTNDNLDSVYMDTNDDYMEYVKSCVMHVILTPRGSKLRDPEFGTDLIKYIFNQEDGLTFSAIKDEITSKVSRYVPSVIFGDIDIFRDDNDEHGIIVQVNYKVKQGNNEQETTVAVKI